MRFSEPNCKTMNFDMNKSRAEYRCKIFGREQWTMDELRPDMWPYSNSILTRLIIFFYQILTYFACSLRVKVAELCSTLTEETHQDKTKFCIFSVAFCKQFLFLHVTHIWILLCTLLLTICTMLMAVHRISKENKLFQRIKTSE